MAYAEIDRENMEIRIIYPTNSPVKKLVEIIKRYINISFFLTLVI